MSSQNCLKRKVNVFKSLEWCDRISLKLISSINVIEVEHLDTKLDMHFYSVI